MSDLSLKLSKLDEILKKRGPALVAFSGGLDSSFLLYRAALVNPAKIMALTVDSLLMSPADRRDILKVLEDLKGKGALFEHRFLKFDPLALSGLAENSPDRCYFCKKNLASLWKAEAARLGLAQVYEGGQKDDEGAHRPGKKALLEEGLKSPLAEAGLDKDDLRKAAETLGLWGFRRPSQACLASRVPYGQALDERILKRICRTEEILLDAGFSGARARVSGDLLRLELGLEDLKRLSEGNGWAEFFQRMPKALKNLGWSFLTVDMEGYRGGCFDKPGA